MRRAARCLVVLTLLLAAALPLPAQSDEPLDLLIRGGTLVDGTGGAARRVDVGVRGDRIVAVGRLSNTSAARVIDAKGLVVAPGFIDVHAHADGVAVKRPHAWNFVAMGVTTIITGNCGRSAGDLGKHFANVERVGIAINYGSLIGHGTVRQQIMGTVNRAPRVAELNQMKEKVARAMTAGAVGMSTGLIYVPGTYAKIDELIALAKVVAKHGGIYASHMRNEGNRVLEAIDEALTIGRGAGCAVQLSHLKASGKPNWGRSREIVKRIADARAAGVPVTGDQYAYTASSTSLSVLFPSAARAIGMKAFSRKLKDDASFRRAMRRGLERTMRNAGFGDFAYCQIASAPRNAELNGMRISEAAKAVLRDDGPAAQIRMVIKLTIDARGKRIAMVYHKMCEPDVEAIMKAPFVGVACDAGIRKREGNERPHPRGAGNNARVLGRYVRERKVLDLPLAIRKMTSLPAETFKLAGRGTVRVGAFADLVVFDPKQITDRATYREPRLAPRGIRHVIVNGTFALDDGKLTDTRAGRVLRHGKLEDR